LHGEDLALGLLADRLISPCAIAPPALAATTAALAVDQLALDASGNSTAQDLAELLDLLADRPDPPPTSAAPPGLRWPTSLPPCDAADLGRAARALGPGR